MTNVSVDSEILYVTKIEAGRRQLNTAIKMWFNGDDEVSTHTLAHASHDILFYLNKNKRQKTLIYDASFVKEEGRKRFNDIFRMPGNFFKHASNNVNPEEKIEFNPHITEAFLCFSVVALIYDEYEVTEEETALMIWVMFHSVGLIGDEFINLMSQLVEIQEWEYLKSLPKKEFFDQFFLAHKKFNEN